MLKRLETRKARRRPTDARRGTCRPTNEDGLAPAGKATRQAHLTHTQGGHAGNGAAGTDRVAYRSANPNGIRGNAGHHGHRGPAKTSGETPALRRRLDLLKLTAWLERGTFPPGPVGSLVSRPKVGGTLHIGILPDEPASRRQNRLSNVARGADFVGIAVGPNQPRKLLAHQGQHTTGNLNVPPNSEEELPPTTEAASTTFSAEALRIPMFAGKSAQARRLRRRRTLKSHLDLSWQGVTLKNRRMLLVTSEQGPDIRTSHRSRGGRTQNLAKRLNKVGGFFGNTSTAKTLGQLRRQ